MFKMITSRSTQHIIRKLLTKTRLGQAAGGSRNSVLMQQTRLIQSVSRYLSTSQPKLNTEEVEVTFVRFGGERITTKGKVGDSLLDVVQNNQLDFDGFGACEGTLTCSTCHVILSTEDFNALPNTPAEEETDMLDLAFDLEDTSRLGCQVVLSKELNGMVVHLPATINDARNS